MITIEKSIYKYTYYDNQTDEQWLNSKRKSEPTSICYYLIIKDNNKTVGCCKVCNKTNHIYISDMSIMPSKRGNGYGKMLIEYVQKMNMPIKLIPEQNAIGFYQKLGFVLYKHPILNVMWYKDPV